MLSHFHTGERGGCSQGGTGPLLFFSQSSVAEIRITVSSTISGICCAVLTWDVKGLVKGPASYQQPGPVDSASRSVSLRSRHPEQVPFLTQQPLPPGQLTLVPLSHLGLVYRHQTQILRKEQGTAFELKHGFYCCTYCW
jgi:hypothetical protein